MSACFPNVRTGQNSDGELVGVTGPTHVLCESGPCFYIRPPPCLQSDYNMNVSCTTVCGPECFGTLSENYCNGYDNSRGLVVRINCPKDTVCIPGGFLKSDICNGRVYTTGREDLSCRS